MSTPGRLRVRALRGLKRAAPASVRKLGQRVAGRRYIEARRAAAEPVLSVVIPVYNVEKYLRECLDSVLGQTLENLEVIAVDDGSTDRCLEILHEYAARDYRVHVYQQTNSGQGIARNLAVPHARGEFLTFLDSDDSIPPRAYDHMVRSLQQTGSDFSVGSARRFSNQRYIRTPWARMVHRSDRFGTTIDEFPEAMQDIIACNRMFRTQFWVEKVGEFRGHIAYEDHVPMLTAYVRAARFDVLARVTYNWRIREDLSSTGQQKRSLENLLDRIAVKEEANTLLRAEASKVVYDAWVARTLEVDFPSFIGHAITGDEVYRNILSATFRTYLSRASDEALKGVRFRQKVRDWLISESRWSDLDAAEEYFRTAGQLPPTQVVDGVVVAATSPQSSFLQAAPPWVIRLSPHETSFDAALEHVRWADADRVEVSGWALIRGLDASEEHPDTEAWLEETTTGEKFPLDLTPQVNPEATHWARHYNAAYDCTGFAITIGTAALVGAAKHPASQWRLRIRVRHQGITRRGLVHASLAGSAARTALPRCRDVASAPLTVIPHFDGQHGFCIDVSAAQITAEDLAVEPDSRRLTGRIRVVDEQLGVPREVAAQSRAGELTTKATLRPGANGSYSFELTIPPVVSAPGQSTRQDWDVVVAFGRDVVLPIAWSSDDLVVGEQRVGGVHWSQRADGQTKIVSDAPALDIVGSTVAEDEIILEIIREGVDDAALHAVRLRNERTSLELVGLDDHDDRTATLRFSMHTSVLGGPRLPAPSANYWLSVTMPDGQELVARPADDLLADLPVTHRGELMNVRSWILPSGEHRLTVGPPLAESEEGISRQKALQRDYQASTVEPTSSVLFQCYRGEFATDSQRALDLGLQKARPELARYWGVSDLSVQLPDGAVPLVMGSRAWYDALASATYLCNNIDFDAFFRKRPHQKYLQTFHGYPFKSMGISFWEGKGYGPERIALEVARRNDEWDSILVPSEMCAEFYRTEYSYGGHILVEGYPRSDFPVNADKLVVRAEVLGRLGVSTSKTVVLYAPTYRDQLTTKTYAAKLFDDLDLAALTRGLGGDFVILLRGHNNNQRESERVLDVAHVVDVTDYPEINELTVAADVAILDYSSLRFDWALTRKPMLFFVPDLDEYFESRPPLFDYKGSAPGPLLATTAEVVRSLQRLAQVSGEYATAIDDFNARFNGLHDGHATERVIDAFFR